MVETLSNDFYFFWGILTRFALRMTGEKCQNLSNDFYFFAGDPHALRAEDDGREVLKPFQRLLFFRGGSSRASR